MKPLKRWQEPIYALGSLGANLLNNVVLSWILFYYRPSEAEVERTGALLLVGATAASAVWIVARLVDGLCDLPIATWTDNLRSRWGRRRPMMAAGLIPMAIAFVLIWYPPVPSQHWSNVVWMALFSSAFFFCYTFVVVPYLALLSELAGDESARMRIASWQATFSTLGIAAVLIASPRLIDRLGYQRLAWLAVVPATLCFLGPILVVREPRSDGAVRGRPAPASLSLWRSAATTLANRAFAIYMLSTATFHLGLQLFVTGQPYIVTAVMGLEKGQAGPLNLGTFALIPLALLALNAISRRRGAKWAYRLALLVFGVVTLLYPLTWARLDLPLPPLALGAALNALAGYPIAVFLTVPNAFPAEIAHREALRTGVGRAGMYFAVQGAIDQVIAALAGALLVQLTTHLGSSLERPYGALILGPLAGLLCFVSRALFAPYPLGRPQGEPGSERAAG